MTDQKPTAVQAQVRREGDPLVMAHQTVVLVARQPSRDRDIAIAREGER